MKKLNKAQKKLIKEKIMKILHIICYILSVLFILTMVIVGVQSCQKQPKKQSAETDYQLPHKAINLPNNDYYVYEFKWHDNMSLVDSSNYINELFDVSLDVVQETSPTISIEVTDGNEDYNQEVLIDEDLYRLNSFIFYFSPISNGYNYYYRLSSVALIYYSDSVTLNRLFYVSFTTYESPDTYNYYVNSSVGQIFLSGHQLEDERLLYFYEEGSISSFTFNKVFNYNAPINSNIQSPYGTGGNWTSSTADSAYIDYETGYFISNGQLFNKIRVYYFATGSMYFQYSDGNIKLGPSGSWSYMFMYYYNTYANTNVLVNQRDLVAFMPTSSSHGYYNANSSTWVVDEYRNVIFLNELSDTTRNKINAFNNNNQTSYSGYVGSGDITNVFSLVGSAFSGLLPILSTYLLPGITIGMLLFIPLVAMLVFAIIRIIKK